MLWNRRRTPRWQSLSLAARGAAEGIAVALDDRGELSLGKRGLSGLAALLSRPWDEVEPAVAELLESDTFLFDEERRVILDPQHPHRQAARTLPDRPDIPDVVRTRPDMSRTRPLSTKPDAVRKRKTRAVSKGSESSQLELAASGTPGADLDLSPLSLTKEIRISRPLSDVVEHDPEQPPPEAVEVAASERPDLSEYVVRRSWRRFAGKTLRHASMQEAMFHWANWVRREDVAKTGPWRTESPPEPPAPTQDRPVAEPAAPASPPPAPASVRRALDRPRPALAPPEVVGNLLGALEAIPRDPPEPRSLSA